MSPGRDRRTRSAMALPNGRDRVQGKREWRRWLARLLCRSYRSARACRNTLAPRAAYDVSALTQLLRRALLGELDVGGFDHRAPLVHLIFEVGPERFGR